MALGARCALLTFVCVFLGGLESFNVDTTLPKLFVPPTAGKSKSYFGFSVAFHGISESDILVGAPKMDNDRGKLFQCIPKLSQCHPVKDELDESTKDIVWFGVSISSQNANSGSAVACSHRANQRNSNKTHFNHKGLCALFGPTMSWGHLIEPCDSCQFCMRESYSDCQTGTSVHFDANGEILMGGPSFNDAIGILFKTSRDSYDLSQSAIELAKKYSYLGTAVRIGKLIGNQITYVSSAPKSGIYGRVVLTTESKNKLKVESRNVLTGDKPFSGFGNDLAIGDFNKDGYDDLVVGAPYYYEQGGTTGGAIYVYLNGPEDITYATKPTKILSRKMKESECLRLKCYDARFGFSLGSVGDLDFDGYPDLLVGAPFEGSGVVYVFSGSPRGLSSAFSQRITASDLNITPSPSVLSFGYSFSQGPFDVDMNSYPDVAIGSFMTDHVFLLRTRPVLNTVHTFQGSPSSLNYRKPSCGRNATGTKITQSCFNVTVCVKFSLRSNSVRETFDVRYNVTLEKGAGGSDRASFDSHALQPEYSGTITMLPQQENSFACATEWVYILSTNRDWLNPVVLWLSYEVINLIVPTASSGLPKFDAYPILNNSALKDKPKIMINFDKDCGEDNVCKCDLKVTLDVKSEKNSEGRQTLKASRTLRVEVTVGNTIEAAHQTMLHLKLPHNVVFIGTDSLEEQVPCIPSESDQLVCDVGNPLDPGENVTFTIKLNPSKITAFQETIVISAYVSSTSEEDNYSDNNSTLELDVLSEADLSLVSHPTPSTVFYSRQTDAELSRDFKPSNVQEAGPDMVHVFEVKNIGKVDLPQSTLSIQWPDSLVGGGDMFPFFYLVAEPEVSEGLCNVERHLINPSNFKFDDYSNYEKMRTKRKLSTEVAVSLHLRCGDKSVRCSSINCSINALKPGDSSVVKISSRFWNSTFQKVFPNDAAAVVYVGGRLVLPPVIRQLSIDNDHHESKTLLLRDEREEEEAPLWIYLVAALAGLLILIFFIIIMWKLGFFKRKTHEGLQQYSVTVTKKEVNEADKK